MSLKPIPKVVWTDTSACPAKGGLRDSDLRDFPRTGARSICSENRSDEFTGTEIAKEKMARSLGSEIRNSRISARPRRLSSWFREFGGGF